jgi:hypothetical protein
MEHGVVVSQIRDADCGLLDRATSSNHLIPHKRVLDRRHTVASRQRNNQVAIYRAE